MSMPVSITATLTPAPVRPSVFCAMSAPVIVIAVARSGAAPPLMFSTIGAWMTSTGYIALTPERRDSFRRSAVLMSIDKPLNSTSKARRSV